MGNKLRWVEDLATHMEMGGEASRSNVADLIDIIRAMAPRATSDDVAFDGWLASQTQLNAEATRRVEQEIRRLRPQGPAKPECPYCGATEGLRVKSSGSGIEAPEYTCEGCFTGTDDSPSFDDLRTSIVQQKRPVAWRVKDYADGWAFFLDEAKAKEMADAMGGALMQALCVPPLTPFESTSISSRP
jgi:hypothetical protein